ncbi:DUF3515 domain-containing protein [Candidatus Mycolicibacterium alkanivorans]|uniref:DUF3515 domain-containing protein n=1 Tax=Candidatus Mycolicibacterium alkanivorans TaxID=2954114 RepID=A0ABS9YZQ8_9MYCO|nr:DUF3515 domain-containing protein [Candidatus Mycolicibacterium alkanivorans]MCI4676577.1 DUF3515 domain-containing protein [Candidatus Mycolicibacterium alkanivorans]
MPTDPAPAATEEPTSDGPPHAVLIAALVVAVAAVGVVLGLAATRRPADQPVAIASVPAPQAGSPECQRLLAALPGQLGDFRRAMALDPVPAGTAAWRAGTDGDAVILRCGLYRPAEFVLGVPIQIVNQVQWFRLDDPDTNRSTWVSVDRPVYVALTLPTGSGPTPIQTMSDLIARTMPPTAVKPGPAR